ncbi:D-2-hydroxyacid dehydrogenase [Thalassospiraceae bacterium LMO-SO8]|nr:D-2-hydroxyacid dehydrogenase [Alphaproteobacteria bacterium LMO-S08]WND76274.1 D-2-hydroxyacid dehydrogenase [Thalassospiraceae bacterium LMO-SO8]
MTDTIVFLDHGSLAPGTTLRAPGFPHQWVDHDETRPGAVADRIKDAAIVVTNKVKVGAADMDAAPGLKLIAVCATGTDIIDLAAAKARGITVCNVRGYAEHSVPEHAFGLILTLRRQIIGYLADVKAGKWQDAGTFTFFTHELRDLYGTRLAVVGRGSLGQGVATIAKGFGMEIVFVGRKGVAAPEAPLIPWDEAIETADVLTLHCPLTPETRGMIGLDEFKRMKRTALVINTARGGLIDEDALVRALTDGLIAGAGMDVVSSEPPPADHPFMALVGRPDFILTPHTAWAGNTARAAMAEQLIQNIENFKKGSPTNVV